eukprot:scaffold629_cov257-Chaetoceros_neogracile.AAC.10
MNSHDEADICSMSTSTTEPLDTKLDPLESKQRKKRRLIANFDTTRQQEIRQANRIAARICRKRKKHLAKELEGTFHSLCTENQLLSSQFDTLSGWVTQLKVSRPGQQQEHPSSSNSTSTKNKSYREETDSTELEQINTSNYPKEADDTFNDTAQFLASANRPFQDQQEQQEDYTNVHENGNNNLSNNNMNNLLPVQAASPDFATTYNSTLQNQTNAAYNPPFQNQGQSSQPQNPGALLFQQQQQNFSRALFPGAFGTNTNVLPMQHMQYPSGAAVPPGQISNMMTSMAPPVHSAPQNVANVTDFQQQLALLGNQNLALTQLLNQNPGLLLGGWNGMNTDTTQFQPQGAGGNTASTTAQQQFNQGFSWPNTSYQQPM